jgi:hypothetical protein
MKLLIVGLAALVSATSAGAAEVWTCPRHGIAIESMKRFTVLAPDTLDETVKLPASLSEWNTAAPDHYRIMQNDDYQLVATRLVYMMTSEGVSSGEKKLAVVTVAINKMIALSPACFALARNGETATALHDR